MFGLFVWPLIIMYYICFQLSAEMEKNSLKYAGLLALVVWGALLLMPLLPSITVGSRVLRRVDILGDVRSQKPVADEPDTLLPPPTEVKPAFVDTCQTGITCIEDYSDSTLAVYDILLPGTRRTCLADVPPRAHRLLRRFLYPGRHPDGRLARDAPEEVCIFIYIRRL